MKLMKLLQSNQTSTEKEKTNESVERPARIKKESVSEGVSNGIIEVAGTMETIDSVETKVSQAIQELFESRRTFQSKLQEDHRAIFNKDASIQELIKDKSFLENKIESLSEEISKTQDDISHRKGQHDQLLNEFNSYKAEQGRKLQKLQDTLQERELTNQQLLLDFNQYRQKSEAREQQLEVQLRDQHVKHQHLEKKYQESLNENGRLNKVIHEFVAKASTSANEQQVR
ncbi:hypothetical protein [Alicyclobacillus sp. SO9]|uniref:hypothetical protein n=1 Tax=Alicyclobacillus sp. SO9 TaxID=2665646 RepID=UPI0018E7E6C1|nr:hypothetical protein [Alicyclobacillus sp. SO9]QQE78919.1 hypothetical protein GI364_24325 [Alicyclobacillus sp. SO9]